MKKRKRTNPEISTASLPDIIFMLLFFFMVVTVLRKDSSKLFHELPEASYNTKIDQSKEAAYVFIGRRDINKDKIYVQINDRIISTSNLDQSFEKLVSDPEIDKELFEITLKADRYTTMKLIRQVKLSMRKAGIRHLYYLTENKV